MNESQRIFEINQIARTINYLFLQPKTSIKLKDKKRLNNGNYLIMLSVQVPLLMCHPVHYVQEIQIRHCRVN